MASGVAPNFAQVEKEAGLATSDALQTIWKQLAPLQIGVNTNRGATSALSSTTLLKANNLSDLTNAGTARSNLGLGTLATQNGTFSGTSSGTNTGDQSRASLGIATSDVVTFAGLTLSTTNPTLLLFDTTGGADQRKASSLITGGKLVLRGLNDDETTRFTLLEADLNSGGVNIPTALSVGGTSVMLEDGASDSVTVLTDLLGSTTTLNFSNGKFTGTS